MCHSASHPFFISKYSITNDQDHGANKGNIQHVYFISFWRLCFFGFASHCKFLFRKNAETFGHVTYYHNNTLLISHPIRSPQILWILIFKMNDKKSDIVVVNIVRYYTLSPITQADWDCHRPSSSRHAASIFTGKNYLWVSSVSDKKIGAGGAFDWIQIISSAPETTYHHGV